MIATIHQPQYLPWLGYFHKAHVADIFIILDNVQFKKNDWQNRNRIRTSQGWQWLSVPVLHNFGQKITEVKINNQTKWRKSHLNAIKMNYSKAPFFDDYIGFFEEVFTREWEYLAELNIYLFEEFIERLGIQTKIIKASDVGDISDESTQRLVDLCKQFEVDTYLSGVDGKKYMDFEKFEENNIHVEIQDFSHPIYSQLWTKEKNEDFISHMSIVDLVFNIGPDSLKTLTQS